MRRCRRACIYVYYSSYCYLQARSNDKKLQPVYTYTRPTVSVLLLDWTFARLSIAPQGRINCKLTWTNEGKKKKKLITSFVNYTLLNYYLLDLLDLLLNKIFRGSTIVLREPCKIIYLQAIDFLVRARDPRLQQEIALNRSLPGGYLNPTTFRAHAGTKTIGSVSLFIFAGYSKRVLERYRYRVFIPEFLGARDTFPNSIIHNTCTSSNQTKRPRNAL